MVLYGGTPWTLSRHPCHTAVVPARRTSLTSGFFLAVLIFTVIEVVTQPLIIKNSMRNASALSGSSALIASFVALVLTTWISDSLQINGFVTWLLATVIVWAAAMLAAFILPTVVFKRWLQDNRARSS